MEIYEDAQFRISREKRAMREFYIKDKQGEISSQYTISVEDIREIVKMPRGELEKKMREIDPQIIVDLEHANLTIDSAHLAICLAYIEEINRPRDSDLPNFLVEGPRGV